VGRREGEKKKKTRGLLSPVSSWPVSSENKRGREEKREKENNSRSAVTCDQLTSVERKEEKG
jgi:hypothetical protein